MTEKPIDSTKYNKVIILLSIVIPLTVAMLFGVKLDIELPVFLPPIYAAINAFTAVVLVLAVWAVASKKIVLHEQLIKVAVLLSICFLVLYIAYHMTSESTTFGGEGIVKYIYYFVLLSHILLSIVVIPFVLITFVRGITRDIEKHKRIAKYTFPLWLYVAVTGVIVYLMIAPYYAV